MRILFITDSFPPEVNAPATRTYEHIKEWQKKGVEVTVITCVPNSPHGKPYKGYVNKLYQKHDFNGIETIRVWSYMTSHSCGFVKRVLDFASFSIMAFLVGVFQKHDIIIATSPQFFTTWTAFGISKLRRKPWIFELRDLWPESIKSVGVMKDGPLFHLLERIELFLYKDATKVVAVTEAFKTNLISRGIEKDKIEVVTNGSNLELFFPRPKDMILVNELVLRDKFVVGYIGTHGLSHSLDFIINTISKIEDKDIHFLFICDGIMKKKMIDMSNDFHLKNVTYLDSVAKEKVPEYLSIIDVSLVPLKKVDNFKTVIPSKIFEASAMKKPTLLGVEGQAQEIIEKYGAGLCFEPENEKDLIEKLMILKNDKQVYEDCQNGCEKLADAFDRKRLASKMLDIILCITK